MSISSETLGAAKKYVKESLLGGGAVVGKNVTISSISPITGGNRVTFSYTLDNGTVNTSTMDVMDGKDGVDGLPGKNGKDGSDGADGSDGVGISKIEKIGTVDLVDTYRITFTDGSTFDYEVKNGKDGQGGSGGEENVIESIKVNGVVQTVAEDKSVDITVPDAYDDTDIRAELANKADTDHTHTTVNGHTVESDVPVDAKFTDTVYDDAQIKTQIQAVANGLMDSVGYSADYKTIDIIAKNGVKKSVNVAPIISHASITELSDVDTTNKATGKALVYNATTSKHEYSDVSGTDEKVKMDASTDAKYLGELLDNVTIANENGELKVKKLDGQEVTITEINYLKGLTMNVMDLVNMFSNGGVKIINTPVATYAELLTLDKSSFIEGVSYLVYVLADENHDNAKTTYLVDKDSETPTYFGFADSQRDFTTNPIDLATEITGKLGIANMDSDAIKALFTVDDTYKTETATNNAFSTHGAKALYDELLLAIGNKANSSDLTAHKDDVDIHVSTEDRTKWDKVVDKVDKIEGKGLSANDYTDEEKALVATIEDKVDKTSIATALDDTVTDEQVASAFLAKTELDKKVDKTSIVTELSDASTDDEVVGALTAYNELQKLESANKGQFATASGDSIAVTDSVDGKLVELGVKGNSFQNSYSGKNLLSKTNISYNATGLTITDNKNGTYGITSGTTTGTEFRLVGAYNNLTKEIHLDTSKTYKVTAKIGSANLSTLCVFTDGSTYTNVNSTQNLFTLPDGFEDISSILIRFDSSASYSGTLEVMLYEYTEGIDETFEPYVGGIPAPNPLYPQEINSVGDDGSLVVKSCGKNVLKNTNGNNSSQGITYTKNSDGSISCTGTQIEHSYYMLNNDLEVDFKGKYILSGNTTTNSNEWGYCLFLQLEVGDNQFNYIFNNTPDEVVCDFSKYPTLRRVRPYIRVGKNATPLTDKTITFYPMLRPYGTDGTYEPYKESTTTIPLSEPLRAIGDVKDEISYQDGKWGVLRRFKKYTFDGSDDESWLLGSTNNFNDVSFTAYIDGLEPVTYKDSWICVPSLCDRFSKKDFLYQNTITDECYMVTSTANANRFSIRLLKSRVSEVTVEAVKVWLASNPITVWYELKTPVFTPFADQTLPYLSTYDGITNISNDDALSAEMTVKYPTTDVSGVGSRNESRIAELAKDTDDVNKSLDTLEFGEVAGGNNIYNGDRTKINGSTTDSRSAFTCVISAYNDSTFVSYLTSYITLSENSNVAIPITFPSNANRVDVKHSGSKKDIHLINYPLSSGNYTVSFKCTKNNPSVANGLEITDIQIEKGTTSLPYEPYIPSVKMLADEVSAQNKSLSFIGKCKNLLNPTLATTTSNGVTCTNNGDGTYTIDTGGSAATADTYLNLINTDNSGLIGKTVKFLGCPNGGNLDSGYSIWSNDEYNGSGDIGTGAVLKLTSNKLKMDIQVMEGTSCDNLVFKPMLTTNLNATYDDFVPYTGDGDTLTHDIADLKNDLSVKKFELVAGVLWLCVCGKHCVLTLNGYNLTEPTHFDKLEEYQPYLVARNVVSKGDGVCIAAVEPNGNINASDLVVGTSLTGQLFGEISWIANI